ncbi:3'-5' exonuclease [Streptomyces incarnatus]
MREYAEHDPAGSDLQPFANLVDEHGPDAILQAIGRLVPEDKAQVTVSTAHKAKGREWAQVRIAPDFTPPTNSGEIDAAGCSIPGTIDAAEARLAYVPVTRARRHLDPVGLAWISQHPDNPEIPQT